jgi:hypothetical protein
MRLSIITSFISIFTLALTFPTSLSPRFEMAVPRCAGHIPGICMLGTVQWGNQEQMSISVFDKYVPHVHCLTTPSLSPASLPRRLALHLQ